MPPGLPLALALSWSTGMPDEHIHVPKSNCTNSGEVEVEEEAVTKWWKLDPLFIIIALDSNGTFDFFLNKNLWSLDKRF